MILINSMDRDLENKTESSCQRESFGERNFLGTLFLRKEILI